MVREFRLINEKGQEYSLMDIENHILLTEPSGLGYSYSTDYQQLGNTFISNLRRMEQGQISGTANFLEYDNFRDFIDFVEGSESLRFAYKIPYKNEGNKEYFKDIEIQSISKTQKQTNGIFSETVTFDCLSLWYEENTSTYIIEPSEKEIRWNFKWNRRFSNYTIRRLEYINRGHTQAPIYAEIEGSVINPNIEIYLDGILFQKIPLFITIQENEKLIYDSREAHFEISREKANGMIENLFNLDYIDFSNDNVVRIPKNKNCIIAITAENEIKKAQITIYPQFKVV